MNIHILLADNYQMIREGLRSLLEKEADFDVVGEAEDGRMAVQLAESLKPDVVVIDAVMPELNGIDATRRIRAFSKTIQVIGLSIHSNQQYVTGMIAAGASGYILKDDAFYDLAQGIRMVLNQQMYVSPTIAHLVVQAYQTSVNGGESNIAPVLTAREREVLQLLVEGHSIHNIADELHVSMRTIESHRAHIMEKLNFRSLADLTKYAIREGITSL